MKILTVISGCFFLSLSTFAQPGSSASHGSSPGQSSFDEVSPGSKSINVAYLRPRSVFQKLSWFDSTGRLMAVATLNCVTKIDTPQGKLIYLQIRNDGKRDSTIADWPNLKPVYTASRGGNQELIYDHHGGNMVRTSVLKNGARTHDTSYAMPSPFFDAYLTDYLFGALPLRPGYHAKFITGGDSPGEVTIREVYTDLLPSGDGKSVQAYLLDVGFTNFNVLYWIDKSSGDLLKSIYQFGDGRMFMKSKI